MKQVKEISLLTHHYAMLLPPEQTYKHLLRFSKNWASGKKYNDFSSDEESWSYQTKNEKYVSEFEHLVWICSEFIRTKGEEPFMIMTDVGEYCLRITFNDNTHINFERSSDLFANGMDEIAKQMVRMIPKEEFVPDSIKLKNTLEDNLFELCDYLRDKELSISILESMMSEFHLITRDHDELKKLNEEKIALISKSDLENMDYLDLLNIVSFVLSINTMKLASQFLDSGLFVTISRRLSDFIYEQDEHLKGSVRKWFLFNVYYDACNCSCISGYDNRPTIDLNYSKGIISFIRGRYLENISYQLDDWDQNLDFEFTKRLWNEDKITIVEGLRIEGDYHIAITIGGRNYEE